MLEYITAVLNNTKNSFELQVPVSQPDKLSGSTFAHFRCLKFWYFKHFSLFSETIYLAFNKKG